MMGDTNSLRLFNVLWGTFNLSWGFFHAQANWLGWSALLLGFFSLLAIREHWERFPRSALIIAFSLATFGVLGSVQGGWMMAGVIGYATFYYLSRLRRMRDLSLQKTYAWRLGALHVAAFLMATLFSSLEGSLSPSWYVTWGLNFLAISLFINKNSRLS